MLFSLYSDREKPPPPGGVSFLVGFRNRHEGRGKTSSFLWKNCGCFFHGGSYCSWLLSWKPPIKETPPDLGGGEFCRSTLCHLDSWLGSPRWKGIRTYDMTHLYVTWLIHICDMTHSYVCDMTHHSYVWSVSCSFVWHDSFCRWGSPPWKGIRTCDMTHLCVTWLFHMYEMTHSCVWHDVFICVTWLIHMCDLTHSYVWHTHLCVWHGSFSRCDPPPCKGIRECDMPDWYVTWLIHICDLTHLHVWHDVFICVTWPVVSMQPTTSSTYSYTWHDSFICVTWIIHMCDMPHPYVWHDLFICVTWLVFDSPRTWMSHATYE